MARDDYAAPPPFGTVMDDGCSVKDRIEALARCEVVPDDPVGTEIILTKVAAQHTPATASH